MLPNNDNFQQFAVFAQVMPSLFNNNRQQSTLRNGGGCALRSEVVVSQNKGESGPEPAQTGMLSQGATNGEVCVGFRIVQPTSSNVCSKKRESYAPNLDLSGECLHNVRYVKQVF